MSLTRTVAQRLLAFAVRHAGSDNRDWADAMLAEFDAVDGDWAALQWSWGGTTALWWRSARRVRPARHAVLLGMVAAGVVLIASLHLSFKRTRHVPGADGLAAITAQEARNPGPSR